jgi:ribosomal protein L2
MLPFSHKLLSLVVLSSGSLTYIPSTVNHKIFVLTKFCSIFDQTHKSKHKLWSIPKMADIHNGFSILKQLPRNKPISLLELVPGKGIQYVRSPGTSAKMPKKD